MPCAPEPRALTQAALVRALAAAEGLPAARARRLVRAFVATVAAALGRGERVALRGLGTWSVAWAPARRRGEPASGGVVVVPGRRRVRFRAAPAARPASRG